MQRKTNWWFYKLNKNTCDFSHERFKKVRDTLSTVFSHDISDYYSTIIRATLPVEFSDCDDKFCEDYVTDSDVEFLVVSPSEKIICIHAKKKLKKNRHIYIFNSSIIM